MADINQILSSLPNGFLALGHENHAQNTANFSNLLNAVNTVQGGGGDPTKKDVPVNQDAAAKFGNWLGTQDSKLMSADLMKRNLTGADQLVFENQKIDTADNIKNKNQSDWKVAAIQNMLSQAFKVGIKTPEAVTANWDYLTQGKWKDALNDPTFAVVHPNFPDVFKKLLADQWAKQDKQNNSQTAKTN